MNRELVASELVRVAKLLTSGHVQGWPADIDSNNVIGVKSAYYTNSGIDMGQYDETRSATVVLYVGDLGEVMGWATANVYGAQHPGAGETITDRQEFGRIDGVAYLTTIEKWADQWFVQARLSGEVKKGWTPYGTRRRMALKNLIAQMRDRKQGVPA